MGYIVGFLLSIPLLIAIRVLERYLLQPRFQLPRIIRRLSKRRRELVTIVNREEAKLKDLYTSPRDFPFGQYYPDDERRIENQQEKIRMLRVPLEAITYELHFWLDDYRKFIESANRAVPAPALADGYRVSVSPIKMRVPEDIEQIDREVEAEVKKLEDEYP